MTFYRFPYLLLFLCFAIGCGGSGDRVTGTVTFSDGSPLTVGKVMFTNGTITAFGDINSKGEYRMGTKKAGDGVPSGTYQVYITEALVPAGEQFSMKDEDGNTYSPLVLAIDPKFTVPSQCGLVCEVKGKTVFPIQVEKPPAGYSPFSLQDQRSAVRSSD